MCTLKARDVEQVRVEKEYEPPCCARITETLKPVHNSKPIQHSVHFANALNDIFESAQACCET